MHSREITHILNSDSKSKTQLIVQTKYSFCFQLRKMYINTKKINNGL